MQRAPAVPIPGDVLLLALGHFENFSMDLMLGEKRGLCRALIGNQFSCEAEGRLTLGFLPLWVVWACVIIAALREVGEHTNIK